MKRIGNVMPLVADRENLLEAFCKAVRGKRERGEVQRFCLHINEHLEKMHEELLQGTFSFGNYRLFTIYDPKERLICAAPFEQRVAMHALMRICHPVYEAFQMSHSFASRLGKGTYAAIDRAQQQCRRYEWYAKLDVQHYFDTIHHDTLRRQQACLFKDKVLLHLFDTLLNSYETTPGRGLPIGNLTSQYFANHYLAVADHFAKEQLHVAAMVRYMDDVLLFAHTHEELMQKVKAYTQFVESELLLQLHPPVVNRTAYGIPFCGYVVRANGLRLNQRSRHRYLHRMAVLRKAYDQGEILLTEYGRRIQALRSFVAKAQATQFVNKEALRYSY